MRLVLITFASLAALLILAVAAMIAFGGPKEPAPLASISNDVRKRDRSDAPQPAGFKARDGATLTYRIYRSNEAAPSATVAVLVHGSAGGAINMHEVARALQKAGIDSIAPDFRGHGGSGTKGDISYVGQLEDDLADVLAEADRLGLAARRIIVGHSAGGGFVMRQAAGPLWSKFAGDIMLAPYVGYNAPTSKPNDGWAGAGLPRIYGLTAANLVGIHAFDGLPALAFGVPEQAKPYVTAAYSFRLMQNFGPGVQWRTALEKLNGAVYVLVGSSDELFHAERYADLFGPRARVQVIPGISHMGITGEPAALAAVVAAAREISALPAR
jgi:pimeloyl-ACP methyl ester carboxylesterase